MGVAEDATHLHPSRATRPTDPEFLHEERQNPGTRSSTRYTLMERERDAAAARDIEAARDQMAHETRDLAELARPESGYRSLGCGR